MSENKDEAKNENNDDSGVGISDDQLPEDLVPSEDNPLAEGLPDGKTVDDVRTEGKQSHDDEPDTHQAADASAADSGDQGDS